MYTPVPTTEVRGSPPTRDSAPTRDSPPSPTIDSSETDQLLEPQLVALRGHKYQCALAIVLVTVGLLGDAIRWLLLLIFNDRGQAYYFANPHVRRFVIFSVTWDCICYALCFGIFMVHKKWIPLEEYGRWSRVRLLTLSLVSRILSMAGMIWGDVSFSYGFSVFIFATQIIYYFNLIYPWIPVFRGFIRALKHPLPSVTIQGVSQRGTPLQQPLPSQPVEQDRLLSNSDVEMMMQLTASVVDNLNVSVVSVPDIQVPCKIQASNTQASVANTSVTSSMNSSQATQNFETPPSSPKPQDPFLANSPPIVTASLLVANPNVELQ
jgi:hypothetical protein